MVWVAGGQALIGALWEHCNGVTLPDEIYFDPAKTLTGRPGRQFARRLPSITAEAQPGILEHKHQVTTWSKAS